MMVNCILSAQHVIRVLITLAKCVNDNVINNHAIMKRDYKCGYCSKSKNWPDLSLSSQPPLPVVASTFGMIRPAVLHNAIRGRQQYQVILRAKPIVIHVDHRRREDGGGFLDLSGC